MIRVTLLGATGSIGQSTLDVLARNSEAYQLVGVSGHQRLQELLDICIRFQPFYASVPEAAANPFQQQLRDAGCRTEVLAGPAGLEQLAAEPGSDLVVAAIVGAAGLLPTLAAVKAGKRILLANKEALVMSGALFMDAVQQHGATLLPVDSEHNAIFQCLPDHFASQGLAGSGVERLLLTASGGPFRGWSREQLQSVTPAQAVAHPNWSMGQKISVDSATLMNKGLELIEACWLFNLPPSRIDVVIHPQSIIHSMVSYRDGSVLAQLGNPDMRTPIAHALAWPERIHAGVSPLDLVKYGTLSFEAPDEAAFPCLRLAREAFQAGGTAPAILNAANEVAVTAFLERRIGFLQIPETLERVLQLSKVCPANDLQLLLSEDQLARQLARQIIEQFH
ncbi:1-deoxy-D-xylulose-5-phosphate reductoisomerase [Marinospirillum alkaliphilum]|uniref:1-deoxy-D-xylulose 5-phosphate reductoisomerase n=1 Tax=Marinospirillum alkaliphilum DSM 21637 TaxID=1122209 RepID=A0A1K1W2I3_9GAMM|nr:1-deoxy-D-xylulose-5-phosphate reductoisomerase [Marinospirillum alkaliphilum]SFX31578.1 1-deoxy-D-xylulose 5-phosphate reductoisomerase [Marinospirillum alkaliphilum DSM 21637]